MIFKMKILKIIHGYPPDYNAGSEVYSQSICNELSKKHSVFIFTREENPYTADHEIVREVRENMVFYITNKAREKVTKDENGIFKRLSNPASRRVALLQKSRSILYCSR